MTRYQFAPATGPQDGPWQIHPYEALQVATGETLYRKTIDGTGQLDAEPMLRAFAKQIAPWRTKDDELTGRLAAVWAAADAQLADEDKTQALWQQHRAMFRQMVYDEFAKC